MEQTPTDVENHLNKLSFSDIKNQKEKTFQLALDYYNKDNPFKKVIIGSTIGAVGSYSAAIIAIGMSGAYISGGVLFYDTALVLGGYGVIAGTVGLVIGIPAILGGIGYAIYKVVKTKKMKKYMNKISDKNDETAIEEREILALLTKECLDYYKNYINSSFKSKLKDKIQKDTSELLKLIKTYSNNSNKEIANKIKNEINEMNFINIIVIGSTGVGKSTLINEFLRLKNNQAKEGNTPDPQKIEAGWPKKYPVDEKDTDIIGINLYDTEGIEKTGENNFKTHLSKVCNFINSPESDLKNKVNAIWYCINSNRLDGDQEYIDTILNLFEELKIPIIFIFTKAFEIRLNDIASVHEGLKNFVYFKEHPDQLHFQEVIAKEMISQRTGKVMESKFGLDKLLDKTKEISKKTIMAPIIKKISDELNKKSMKIIEDLSNKLQQQYNDFICKHDKFKTFRKKLYEIFQTIYGDIPFDAVYSIENKIQEWVDIAESIQKNDLKQAIKNFGKDYLINKIENVIKQKYDEKIAKNEGLPEDQKYKNDYKTFKKEIEDYLIIQINSAKDIYGLYSLFDIIRDNIIEVIFKDLEIDLNKQKIEITKELEDTIQDKIVEFSKKLMS